jgi:iron(III) transport system permease protein
MSSLVSSLQLALIATILASAIGLAFALLASRPDVPGKRFWLWMLLLPLCLPAHGFMRRFVPQPLDPATPGEALNFLEPTLMFDANLLAAAAELAIAYFPLVALPTLWRLIHVDRRVTEAAILYRSSIPVFCRIKLPLVVPFALTGAGLVFVFCLFDYMIPAVYRIQTLSTVWTPGSGAFREILPAAVQLVLFFVAAVLVSGRLTREIHRMQAETGGANERSHVTGETCSKTGIAALTALMILLAATILLPLLLSAFPSVFNRCALSAEKIVRSHFVLGGFAAFMAAMLLPASAEGRAENFRRQVQLRRSLKGWLFLFLPAVLITGLSPALDLTVSQGIYLGLWVATVCSAAQFLAVCVGYGNGAVFFISSPMRQAALLYQASHWDRYRRILMPLSAQRRVLSAAVAFVLSRSLGVVAGTPAPPVAAPPLVEPVTVPEATATEPMALVAFFGVNLLVLLLAAGFSGGNKWLRRLNRMRLFRFLQASMVSIGISGRRPKWSR